ncbi:MAG TPA: 30S ribosomal protein S16 [Candidatus Paceibacterota bacterium]|nr:30S ribosomal protein S16 [Candidatus Paceibacterota bacterium]
MLIIRLQRVGKKNEPTFRIVLTDSKNSTKSGKFLEVLGAYDARDKNETKIDVDRAKHWISKGAKLSDTIHNLFINKKIITGKKINVLPKKSPIKKEAAEGEAKTEEAKPAEAKSAEAPKSEEKKSEEAKA